MIDADTSCLLKVLRPEPLSEAVWRAIQEEDSVIVSVLAELETFVQLKADWGGDADSKSMAASRSAIWSPEEPAAL